MAGFCKYCGAQLPDNARFCRRCGKPVAPGGIQPTYTEQFVNKRYGSQQGPENNGNVKKKKSAGFHVFMALLLVLCITVVSVGGYYLYNSYIADFISDNTKYREFKDASYPEGNSKAFTETPVDGITISAKAGALSEDTDIHFTEIEDDSYYEEFKEPLENLGAEILCAYDLDMGLEPEETIPGYVDLSFDLKEMGIPEVLWENIEIYRQREEYDEDEPEGSFEKYASVLSDEGVLTVSTTKNCPILVTVGGYAAVIIGGAALVAGGINFGRDVYNQYKDFSWSTTLLLNNREKWDFDVRVDLKNTEFNNSPEGKEAIAAAKEFNEYCLKLSKKAKEEYIREVNRLADDGKAGIAIFKWAQRQKRVKEIKKTLDENTFIKKYFNKDKKFNELSSKLKLPDSVKKTMEVINDAYEYINSQSIKLPGRAIEFDILPINEEGLKVSSLTYPSYIQLKSTALVRGGVYDLSGVDKFRLSCTHEFFHICQEEYAPSGKRKVKELVEDTRFEEATAAVLERDASVYYYSKGIQTTNPDQQSGGTLGYVTRSENYCYGVPLNELPKSSKWIDIGYTEADLIDYLRKNKSRVSIAALMNTYKDTSPQTRFVDILCSKDTFNINKGEEWRKLYHDFILKEVKKIANKTVAGMSLFPDYIKDIRAKMSNSGDVFKWEIKGTNVAHVKTIWQQFERGKKKKYVLILETNEEYADDKDILLRIMNSEDEFIYNDRNYSDPTDMSMMDVLICRAYGKEGTADRVPLEVYAISIFEPEAPHASLTGTIARVTTVEAPDRLRKAEKVTALRTVFKYGKKEVVKDTPLDSDDPENRLGEEIKIDISGLGEIKYPDDLKCTQSWIYVDKKGKEYTGPEVEGVIDRDDITGTYNASVRINNFQLGDGLYTLFGGLAGGIARMFGADPTEDQIRDAVNSGVEWHVESIDYNQTLKVSHVEKDRYKVEMTTDKFGDMVYSGTLDADNVLSLKLEHSTAPKSSGSEDGIDISLDDFLGKISLCFKKDKNGEFYIDGSRDIGTAMIKAVYTCTGVKVK